MEISNFICPLCDYCNTTSDDRVNKKTILIFKNALMVQKSKLFLIDEKLKYTDREIKQKNDNFKVERLDEDNRRTMFFVF